MLEAVAAGKFNGLETMITRRITLEDFVEKGMKALIYEKDEHGKHIVFCTILAKRQPGTDMFATVVKILVRPDPWGPSRL